MTLPRPLATLALLLLVGGGVVGLAQAVGRVDDAPSLVVTADQVRALHGDFARRHGRPPTAEEEAELLDDLVETEVLYREGIALRVHEGDPIVRRRVVERMRSLAEASVQLPTPTDAELSTWLADHPDDYRLPARTHFVHVFFASAAGVDGQGAAAEAVAALRSGASRAGLGDPFVHGADFAGASPTEVSGRFGTPFALALESAPVGTWTSLPSAYGWHAVRVEARSPAQAPTLDMAREAVTRDWRAAQRDAAVAHHVETARARWSVEIRTP